MVQVPTIVLNDGNRMPQLGFGVWQVPDNEAEAAVLSAFEAGYRSIDTAQLYKNEEGVGRAMKASGVPRDEMFITTKVWNSDQGLDQTLRAFDTSLRKLGTDYVDLYLIHWPSAHRGLYAESWKALIQLRQQGRVRSIGVSNFSPPHLQRVIDETGVVPAVNQIELHPRFAQKTLRAAHAQHGVITEAWSPLGQGKLLSDPVVAAVAGKHGRSPAQVILRWHLDHGWVVIPKSVTPSRIRENFDVFGFSLDHDDLQKLDGLDDPAGRIGPDPDIATF